ncbi:hypothetical protein CEXT_564391 [Caerostris extrusa]|uniref:Uncharacterized protein n=1 Tax=Caerostris extrusa TaxID=172846 RepID=A0AAV4XD31_CAEEX|nr:hypothetical protein CEXT_564391 [Caerostris extrusa]
MIAGVIAIISQSRHKQSSYIIVNRIAKPLHYPPEHSTNSHSLVAVRHALGRVKRTSYLRPLSCMRSRKDQGRGLSSVVQNVVRQVHTHSCQRESKRE